MSAPSQPAPTSAPIQPPSVRRPPPANRPPGQRPVSGQSLTRIAGSLALLASLAACGGGGVDPIEAKLTVEVREVPASTPATPGPPALNCTFEVVGDSIADGLGVAEKPYQAIMRLRPKFTGTSTAVPGQRATDRVVGFYNETRTARFIFLAHGINDLYAQPAALDPVPALRAMANYVKAEGRQPILTGLAPQATPHPLRASTDAAIRAMAADTGTPFLDWGSAPIAIPAEMQDISHPTQAGSLKLVARMVAALDALAPECRP